MRKKDRQQTPAGRMVSSSIGMPESTWRLLRAVAFKRAAAKGGRASVSALLVELVERNRKNFEREAGDYLKLMTKDQRPD